MKIDSEGVNRKNVGLTKREKNIYILKHLLFIILMNQKPKQECFVYKAKVGRKSAEEIDLEVSHLLSAPVQKNSGNSNLKKKKF